MTITDELFTTSTDGAAEDHGPAAAAPCTAETAECTCPEFCERDHDTD